MRRQAAFLKILAAGLFAAACSDALNPAREPVGPGTPLFDVTAIPSQRNGMLGQSGTALGIAFPANPHVGDAIVATFFWYGPAGIINSVTDRLADGTSVGNVYRLASAFTAGPISMATYVATNAQNFPDPNPDGTKRVVVEAHLSSSVPQGGVIVSAFTGVQADPLQAVGATNSNSGVGTTDAAPGPITAAPGALVYGVTVADAFVGLGQPPAPFAPVVQASDDSLPMKADAEAAVLAGGGAVEPHWNWGFAPGSQKTWLATAIELKPASGSPPASSRSRVIRVIAPSPRGTSQS